MIKLKGGKTKNDEYYKKAMGLAAPKMGADAGMAGAAAQGNDMARALGMPSAMPKKAAPVKRHNPTINSVRGEKGNDDDVEQDKDSDFDSDLDMEDDGEIMAQLRAKRIAEMKVESNKKMVERQLGHGLYREIKEDEFLPSVTQSPNAVVHFYHNDFPRCLIIDRHLSVLAKCHPETKFVKMNAEKAPFFVNKLQIVVLPTIVLFKNGIAEDRIMGFEELGQRDDFKTVVLAKRLVEGGVIDRYDRGDDGDDEEQEVADRAFNPIRLALQD